MEHPALGGHPALVGHPALKAAVWDSKLATVQEGFIRAFIRAQYGFNKGPTRHLVNACHYIDRSCKFMLVLNTSQQLSPDGSCCGSGG